MGLDLLDTPVRLTWDFPAAAPGPAAADLPAIAGRIVDGGVFFVTLQGHPLLHSALAEVLALLAGCQLQVVCRGGAEDVARLAQLPSPRAQLLLDAAAFVDPRQGVAKGRLLSAVAALREAGYDPHLILTPLRNNLCNIVDLVRFCSEHKLAKFKLPNAHIGDSFHDYPAADLPRWPDLARFRESWRTFAKDACQLPAMEIHDLFLWEIMTPGLQQNRAEYGGCQAANSLGHVDEQGIVHPCAAWPQPLGKLPDQSLDEVWAAPARLAVRAAIDQTPQGCHGCTALGICFGGCRGLARHLNRAGGERDIMCPGPR